MVNFKEEDIILVTGASSGIGRAICLKLNECGAKVIAVGRSVTRLEETKKMSKSPCNIYLEPKDLSNDINLLPQWISELVKTYGKLMEKIEFKHKPVLLNECIEGLKIKKDGIYIDGTLGGAGHSSKIIEKLSEKGLLIGIDRDKEALQVAEKKLSQYKKETYMEITTILQIY